ncbi:MAG: cytidylate kinase-like family protein [Deltaproteobacteria bacterium]|jgi:cytidylate kinase|nr:cytidylate kinase-like family protein [Deltaproteobacteria bacterium]
MKKEIRSIDQIVTEQLSRWLLASKEVKSEIVKPGPLITISREPGTGGTEIARVLSVRLKMDLLAGQITKHIAENADVSEKSIQAIIEKALTRRDDWLSSLFETRHMWPDKFMFHLNKVINTVKDHGNTVILGLGAQYILPAEKQFRVKLIGSRENRLNRIVNSRGCSRQEAEDYATTTEKDRRTFVKKFFKVDWINPHDYDLTINMDAMTISGAVETIISGFEAWKKSRDL